MKARKNQTVATTDIEFYLQLYNNYSGLTDGEVFIDDYDDQRNLGIKSNSAITIYDNVYTEEELYNKSHPQLSIPQWVRGTPYNTDYAEAAGRDLQLSDDGTYRIGHQYFLCFKYNAWGTSHCAGMKSTVSGVLSGNNGSIYLHINATNVGLGWGCYVYVDSTLIQSWKGGQRKDYLDKEMTININDDLEHTVYVYGTRLSIPTTATELQITAKLQYNY